MNDQISLTSSTAPLWILATVLLWGATNPFLRRATTTTAPPSADNASTKLSWIQQWTLLLTNWRYIVPLALNLCGSAAFVKTLQEADLALASPMVNSLTLAVTWLTGWLLGENVTDTRTTPGFFSSRRISVCMTA
ncbi:hypothetical protein AMAG_13064 [Allomyces macrogynus ATCC 38327]|uniref:Uncharacterized protein n=1 Tax=Allomyces macrogynus (strain ATCC 38327) TaxID=578462 RepID=A0A0L0T0U3_ALLM3|nr:hypothetical protein AMAG_13064 [Allomyces macrogynus ATCC 38327]|eukprot:KNE68408.1 hypothetical protein AMAG_13064 [Allomyces macrogynus ATCC 38327]